MRDAGYTLDMLTVMREGDVQSVRPYANVNNAKNAADDVVDHSMTWRTSGEHAHVASFGSYTFKIERERVR